MIEKGKEGDLSTFSVAINAPSELPGINCHCTIISLENFAAYLFRFSLIQDCLFPDLNACPDFIPS